MKGRLSYTVYLPCDETWNSPERLGPRFVATLDALTAIDPDIFRDWEVGDYSTLTGYPLAEARLRITDIIGHNIINEDFDGSPILDAHYVAAAMTKADSLPRKMHLGISPASGNIILEIGEWNAPADFAFVTYPVFRSALLAMNSIWNPTWACARTLQPVIIDTPLPTGGVHSEAGAWVEIDPTFPVSVFQIPWVAYLSAPFASDIQLPSEILTERTSDGGLLMVATEERLNPAVADHVRRGRIIVETLIARIGMDG